MQGFGELEYQCLVPQLPPANDHVKEMPLVELSVNPAPHYWAKDILAPEK